MTENSRSTSLCPFLSTTQDMKNIQYFTVGNKRLMKEFPKSMRQGIFHSTRMLPEVQGLVLMGRSNILISGAEDHTIKICTMCVLCLFTLLAIFF
ncbi:hypothetical protein PanWU01x14_135070 [Parasponia andersonii]|uniref:Uncharacterized protein n=1 Tax=Parasponia andersonii TaxID=3476 RepID=A0A2P5CP81_PARAD|nr:hypothetical protein PanWU01x14_135070 [Parasponia andersonii]